MEEQNPIPPTNPEPPVKLYGFLFVMALLALAGAIYEYWDITRWESTGGSHSMNSLLALAYNLGGKTCVVGLMGTIMLLFLAFGLQDWVSHRKKKLPPAE